MRFTALLPGRLGLKMWHKRLPIPELQHHEPHGCLVSTLATLMSKCDNITPMSIITLARIYHQIDNRMKIEVRLFIYFYFLLGFLILKVQAYSSFTVQIEMCFLLKSTIKIKGL